MPKLVSLEEHRHVWKARDDHGCKLKFPKLASPYLNYNERRNWMIRMLGLTGEDVSGLF